MSPWKLVWIVQALRDLEGLDQAIAKRVIAKLESAVDDPLRAFPRLTATDYYRLRVGGLPRDRSDVQADSNRDRQRIGHRRSVYDPSSGSAVEA